MKSIYLIFLFLLGTTFCKATIFEGYYVTNNLDTINRKFQINTNWSQEEINPLSFKKKLKILDEENTKKIYHPFQIYSFTIENKIEGDRTF